MRCSYIQKRDVNRRKLHEPQVQSTKLRKKVQLHVNMKQDMEHNQASKMRVVTYRTIYQRKPSMTC